MHETIVQQCRERAKTSWPRNYRRLHLNQTSGQTQLVSDGPKQALWNTVVIFAFITTTLAIGYLIQRNTSIPAIRIGSIILSFFLILLWISFYIYGTWGPGSGETYAIHHQVSDILELPQLKVSIPISQISCAGILKNEQKRMGGEYFIYQYLFVITKDENVYPVIRKTYTYRLGEKYQRFCNEIKIKLAKTDLSSEIT